MSGTATNKYPEAPSEIRKAALINLLTDEDPAIYQVVRNQIIAFGEPATGWMHPHTLSRDPVLRRRAQEIVQHFSRHHADDRFLAFCLNQGEDLNLEEAAWLLSQTQYPDINTEAYQALFDSHAGELREQLDPRGDANHIVGVLNHYVFEVLGFRGDEENYHDPENSYLSRVVDRRKGNPISLCQVYLLLAKRLKLPIAGIGLPGHFICRFQTPSEEYYIDVFNRGKLWTKVDCVQYLIQGNYNPQTEFMAPATPRRMLARICQNLQNAYQLLKMPEETQRILRYATALNRRND